MNAALIEILRDIPKEEIERVLQADGYSRWTYFTDTEAGQAGVLYAGDSSLAAYYPSDAGSLQPGPLGVIELKAIRYVPSQHQLNLEQSGKYLTLQVFSDLDQADQDKVTPQQWQQFLAEHAVRQVVVPAAGQAAHKSSQKTLIIAAAVALIAIGALVVMM